MVISLGKTGSALLLSGEVYPKTEVVKAEGLSAINAADSVLIVGEGTVLFGSEISVFAAVVDFDSGFPCDILRGVPIITCGMGARNTVSITSKTSDRITLSLNRTIATINGSADPMELPFTLAEGYTDFDYMAGFAALIVLGVIT